MPSPIEKLQKFFRLEAERGYDNRAVVGGLDKILPWWEKEARSFSLEDRFIQIVKENLNQYSNLEPDARSEALKNILDNVQANMGSAPPPVERSDRDPGPAKKQAAIESKPKARPAASQPTKTVLRSKGRKPAQELSDSTGTAGLGAPLTVLQGIGPRHAETLSSMGLNTLGDLLYYFPRRYDDYSKLKPINRVEYGDELTIIASIQSIANRPYRNGGSQMTEAVVSDGAGFLRIYWFNQPWLANRLKQGDQIALSGKVDMYLGRLVMNSPDWEDVDQEHLHTNRIVPVYPLTAQITQKWLRRTMHQTVTFWAPRVSDYLPNTIRQSAGLADLATAIKQIHFPDSQSSLEAAQYRLAFDEIFMLQMGVLRQKRNWQAGVAQVFSAEDEWVDQLINRLPYTLTGAQSRTLQDIRTDLGSGRPMNRLIQGDVGSGKTIVAALAAAVVVQNDAQTAFMAPTSILAEQHYRNLSNLMLDSNEAGWCILQPGQVRLLIGSTPAAEKEEIKAGLEDGTVRVVIGTHALIEDNVVFKRLQLAIVDEQHRFGVAQRSILRSKGENPHLLVMTATPIPRSLALTVYGDLDLSVMDEMPAGRQPVDTHVLPPRERERAYQLIRQQIQQNRQVFIIYPLVEQGDRDEAKAAVEERERLQTEIFPHLQIGLLHGRMKPDEKDEVMTAFRDQKYQVLVSTSVVEVGVDIPNATVMLIEGANRFGLSQLHQFRGRVGRGDAKSYCLLIPEKEEPFENERLAAMAETNDGFVLAERDLEQRGPGDFLGTRQSGYADLRMAKLSDVRLIEKARREAQALFEIDPELTNPAHSELEKTLRRFWGNGRGDIS